MYIHIYIHTYIYMHIHKQYIHIKLPVFQSVSLWRTQCFFKGTERGRWKNLGPKLRAQTGPLLDVQKTLL